MKHQIVLINQTTKQDEIGQNIQVENKKTIIGELNDVSLNEISGASQIGVTASYQCVVWQREYNKERYVEIDGQRYKVYRAYATNDRRIELYLEEMTSWQNE